MIDFESFGRAVVANWPIWFVTVTLVVAAVIDGYKLKVPNWLTFPMIISGWIYSAAFSPYAGWEGLLFSLVGTAIGLALLLPAYAIGGISLPLMAGFVVAHVIGAVVSVVGLRRAGFLSLTTVREVLLFTVVAVVLGPLVGGIIGAATATLGSGAPFGRADSDNCNRRDNCQEIRSGKRVTEECHGVSRGSPAVGEG